MKAKLYRAESVRSLDLVIGLLRQALDGASVAGAPKTAAKVRSAIKSAQGARNHAYLRQFRTVRP